MRQKGFTLIEVLIASTLLATVAGLFLGLAVNVQGATRMLGSQAAVADEAREGIQGVIRDLRQASRGSLSPVPGKSLSYRIPEDIDGNGSAIDVSGKLELGPVRTIGLDDKDLNHDGLTKSQLVVVQGSSVRVLANNIAPDEDLNGDGVLSPGEDRNGNGKLDHGVWFEPYRNGVLVTIQTAASYRPGQLVRAALSNLAIPRNP